VNTSHVTARYSVGYTISHRIVHKTSR